MGGWLRISTKSKSIQNSMLYNSVWDTLRKYEIPYAMSCLTSSYQFGIQPETPRVTEWNLYLNWENDSERSELLRLLLTEETSSLCSIEWCHGGLNFTD